MMFRRVITQKNIINKFISGNNHQKAVLKSTFPTAFFSSMPHPQNVIRIPSKTILLAGPGGCAFDKKTVIQAEQALTKHNVKSIIRIGNGERVLTDGDINLLLDEIASSQEHTLMIIMAHGEINATNYHHTLDLMGSNKPTKTIDLLSSISKKLSQKSIDIFSLACHGGAINPDAEELLPPGSTYVALAASALTVSGNDMKRLIETLISECLSKGNVTAEKLLVTYLTKALQQRVPPSITSLNSTVNLHKKFLGHLGVKFSETEQDLIYKCLSLYVNKEKISSLIKIIENATDQYAVNVETYGLALAVCHAASGQMTLEYNREATASMKGSSIKLI